jgi:excisionase family DNA binding protein
MTNNEWLTAKEVAAYLKVSLATVYRWTSEGILKKYKTGRTSRYIKDEVDAAMKGGQVD